MDYEIKYIHLLNIYRKNSTATRFMNCGNTVPESFKVTYFNVFRCKTSNLRVTWMLQTKYFNPLDLSYCTFVVQFVHATFIAVTQCVQSVVLHSYIIEHL